MECLRDECRIYLTGCQRAYCFDKCRKAYSRTNTTHEGGSGSTNPDITVHVQAGNRTRTRKARMVQRLGLCPPAAGSRWNISQPTRVAALTSTTSPAHTLSGSTGAECMTKAELEAAGLRANRVSIPGDYDFAASR